MRDIYKNNNPAIKLAPDLKIAYLSQMHGEVFNEKETVLKNFEDAGFETEAEIVRYLKTYGFEEELVYNKVENLSGGEKNLLQLAKISRHCLATRTFFFWMSRQATLIPIPSLRWNRQLKNMRVLY